MTFLHGKVGFFITNCVSLYIKGDSVYYNSCIKNEPFRCYSELKFATDMTILCCPSFFWHHQPDSAVAWIYSLRGRSAYLLPVLMYFSIATLNIYLCILSYVLKSDLPLVVYTFRLHLFFLIWRKSHKVTHRSFCLDALT